MKNIAFLFFLLFLVLLPVSAFADGEEPESVGAEVLEVSTQDEESKQEMFWDRIESLEQEIEELKLKLKIQQLENVVDGLEALRSISGISIGVMPIEGVNKINSYNYSYNYGFYSNVGDFFREMIFSELSGGINVIESLDDETLYWVQRQDQLVREGFINQISAPTPGELQGVNYFLFGTVTAYQETVTNKDTTLGGLVTITHEDILWRTVSIVVDFRVVDAQTGIVVTGSGFQTEATVWNKEIRGLIVKGPLLLQEAALRFCAQQAAEKIFTIFDQKIEY